MPASRARPERGRFRTFLLTALRHFLISEWERSQAEKRGGGQPMLSLDFACADERFAHEPADPGLTPDQAFDRSWALHLIDQAVDDLRVEYHRTGRGGVFEAPQPLVFEQGGAGDIGRVAAGLGVEPHTLTMALHRLRRRLGEQLRARVAETVATNEEVEVELRHLIAACVAADGSRGSRPQRAQRNDPPHAG